MYIDFGDSTTLFRRFSGSQVRHAHLDKQFVQQIIAQFCIVMDVDMFYMIVDVDAVGSRQNPQRIDDAAAAVAAHMLRPQLHLPRPSTSRRSVSTDDARELRLS